MDRQYIEDKHFEKIDFAVRSLAKAQYEGCQFDHCNFSSIDLSYFGFADCTFNFCNLSSANIFKTAFKNVQFNDCKLMGMRFDTCDPFLFEVCFRDSSLDYSTFYGCRLKKTVFTQSTLKEVDFSMTDLSDAVFDRSDLLSATIENSNLDGADFRTAFNYAFDPERNRLRGAKFSWPGVAGLLAKYGIEIDLA